MEKTIGQQDAPSWQRHDVIHVLRVDDSDRSTFQTNNGPVTIAPTHRLDGTPLTPQEESLPAGGLEALADQARAQREALVSALYAVPLAPDALSKTGVPWSRYRDEVIAQFAPDKLAEADVIEAARQVALAAPMRTWRPSPERRELQKNPRFRARLAQLHSPQERIAYIRRAEGALRAWKTRRANAKKKGGR